VHTTVGCSLKKPLARPPFEARPRRIVAAFYDAPKSWQHTGWHGRGALETHLRSAWSRAPHGVSSGAGCWLRGLQVLAPASSHNDDERIEQDLFGRQWRNLDSTLHTVPSTDWRIKRDLVLYASMRFRDRSLLQALDQTIPTSHYSRTKSAASCAYS